MHFPNLKIFNLVQKRLFCVNVRKPPWRVLFFGTDDFSVYSLSALNEQYRKGILLNKLEVVTTIKGKPNPVTLFSWQENLTLHKWPPDLELGQFDVGLVVSFGHLIPGYVIEKFKFGMLNVHASLLPRWRGAAPIIYALANGDTETGVTIMTIHPKKFDIGEIVAQESISIKPQTNLSKLHKTLAVLGANNLVKVLEDLPQSLQNARPQPKQGITYAPKLGAKFGQIRWDKMTSEQIGNLESAIEGLYHLHTTWKGVSVKLINVKTAVSNTSTHGKNPGYVEFDKDKNLLKVLCLDLNFITVEKVGVLGKKIISAKDFNNGYVKNEAVDYRYFK